MGDAETEGLILGETDGADGLTPGDIDGAMDGLRLGDAGADGLALGARLGLGLSDGLAATDGELPGETEPLGEVEAPGVLGPQATSVRIRSRQARISTILRFMWRKPPI